MLDTTEQQMEVGIVYIINLTFISNRILIVLKN